jgi:hypothetical protein
LAQQQKHYASTQPNSMMRIPTLRCKSSLPPIPQRLLEFVKWPRKRAKAKATVLDDDSEDDGDEGMHGVDDDEPELSEEEMRLLSTKTGGLFSIVLADESHKLKIVRTRTHQAIAQSGMERFVLITATPTINRSADLFRTLSLLWNHLRPGLMVRSELDMDSAEPASYDDYVSVSASAVEAKLTVVNLLDLSDRVRFLNPTGGERQLLTATASNLLPIILQTIQLRRVKGEVI